MARKYQYIIAVILLFLALGFGITLGALAWIFQETPDISNYQGAQETTLIYSAEGELIQRFFTEDRIYVPLDRIPSNLTKAVIASEDTNFYNHRGIDIFGIARAAFTNIIQGERAQGGSTITQQLARNALLSQEKTFYRKIQEIFLAIQFEHLYTKPEILEMYLNEVFFGHSAYGIQTASQQYFNKDVWDLTLSESALLAGILPAPNAYSPLRNPQAALSRRNIVLRRMNDLDFISNNDYDTALNEELDFTQEVVSGQESNTIYFENFIYSQLQDILTEIYGPDGPQMIHGGGLKVYTTLDMKMQQAAENSFYQALSDEGYIPSIQREGMENILQPQGSIVSLDAQTGAVRAMIGGRGNDHFNRAVQSTRQPGSAFKPFVYTAAFQNGYSPASVINDMPVILETSNNRDYMPRNYDNTYRGFISARNGLKDSVNIAAVKFAKDLGITNVIDTARSMGITTFAQNDYSDERYSVALGGLSRGVVPLQMASAYSAFANEGIRAQPYAIEKILDQNDNVIYEARTRRDVVLDEDTAYLMNDMLQSVINEGTGWRIGNSIDYPIGGKTGTTNNNTDAWFVGYTPEIVTAVWLGEDRNVPMQPEYDYETEIGSRQAVMLWRDYKQQIITNNPDLEFVRPDNIVEQEIDPVTGLLPNEYTPTTVTEIFTNENQPEEENDFHGPVEVVEIDQESGQLATENCPEESIIEYHFLENTGVRINPDNLFQQDFSFESDNGDISFSGTYEVPQHHPVQKIDEEIGLPLTTINDKPIYEEKPEEFCELHAPESIDDDSGRNVIDDIWDFINRNDNGEDD